MFVSLVVPAYNESERIRDSLRAIGAYLGEQSYESEIVLVDDGSRDDTFEVACEVAEGLPVRTRVIRYEENRGKGHALKVGFAAADGDHLAFTDADLATPIGYLGEVVGRFERGSDIVIGSRKTEGAAIEIRQPRLREWMGAQFTRLVRFLIADVSDATCGFKAFRGDVGRDLFARLRIDDWSFDAELLLVASRRGYRIEEIPVVWTDRAGSKVRLIQDALGSLLGLVRIWLNTALGRYDHPQPVDLDAELSRSRTFAGEDPRLPRADSAS